MRRIRSPRIRFRRNSSSTHENVPGLRRIGVGVMIEAISVAEVGLNRRAHVFAKSFSCPRISSRQSY